MSFQGYHRPPYLYGSIGAVEGNCCQTIDRIVIREVQYQFKFQGSSAYSVGGDSGQDGETDRRTAEITTISPRFSKSMLPKVTKCWFYSGFGLKSASISHRLSKQSSNNKLVEAKLMLCARLYFMGIESSYPVPTVMTPRAKCPY
ncbi:hypothetical protein DPMN_101875 [Dreissena polymorpha]|uniref:Uncharacterized protein n=1 Tax=Dreissena polymorpha TaxID=45954 RepID=A0A9D4LJT6_DREPO|nr:hypothetical protein DPMN_101875 [Dreissena polymorpha]